jgi:hypothetical protein
MRVHDGRIYTLGNVGVYLTDNGACLVYDRPNANQPKSYRLTTLGVTVHVGMTGYDMLDVSKGAIDSISVRVSDESR